MIILIYKTKTAKLHELIQLEKNRRTLNTKTPHIFT